MAEQELHGEHAHIRCRVIIEVLGKPKEHVEESIKDYVEHIRKDAELVLLKEEFSEAQEQGKLWTQFVELDLVCKGIHKLTSFCFEYMPSSIEIEKPEHLVLTNSELSGVFNDLQARLHSVDMAIKQSKAENDFLKLNMNAIISNIILISLKASAELSSEQLSKVTGIPQKELESFTNKLIEENRIKKEGEIYSLV